MVRNVDLGAVLTFFHQRVRRTVNIDHSDVRIDNLFFAVDPSCVATCDRAVRSLLFHGGSAIVLAGRGLCGTGKRYQREKGSHQQPASATPGS